MGRASIEIDLVESLMSEEGGGPYTEDKRSRAERRWKRREVSGLQNCSGSASKTVKSHGNKAVSIEQNVHIVEDETDEDYKVYLDGSVSKTVKSHGNKAVSIKQNVHIVEDETDEDYKVYLDACVSDIDCASDINVGSEININTDYNSDNDDDDEDPDYKMFLENMREESDSYVYSSHNRAGNVGNASSDSMREQTGRPMQSQKSIDPKSRPCNKMPSSVPQNISHNDVEFDDADGDYQIYLNSCRIDGNNLVYINDDLIRKRSSARQNSRVSNLAFCTPKEHSEADEDYQLYLNSDGIVDGDMVYMPDKNTTMASEVEGGSNSSDSDLIIIEPDLFCEDTPFVSSKVYDSSWFENEMNPGDRKRFSAAHSQFRRRLMECLLKPFDQQECDAALDSVRKRTQIERHKELRGGVIKSYHVSGTVNKSYLELNPDLADAIAAIKEPHRVLFLLRGFFFWLGNLSHAGVFKPWLDEACLEILQRM